MLFELFVEVVVTVAVLAFCGQSRQSTAAASPLHTEAPAPVVVTDETIVSAASTAIDYRAMPIAELKQIGKQMQIPGWKAWKYADRAAARIEAAIAA